MSAGGGVGVPRLSHDARDVPNPPPMDRQTSVKQECIPVGCVLPAR